MLQRLAEGGNVGLLGGRGFPGDQYPDARDFSYLLRPCTPRWDEEGEDEGKHELDGAAPYGGVLSKTRVRSQ